MGFRVRWGIVMVAARISLDPKIVVWQMNVQHFRFHEDLRLRTRILNGLQLAYRTFHTDKP